MLILLSYKKLRIILLKMFWCKILWKSEFVLILILKYLILKCKQWIIINVISDIDYLKTTLPPTIEQTFFAYLKELTAKDVKLYAIDEGSVVFPR